ncbi:hypothetical protein ANO11243_068260 [Dothideomycetidae sp. 11243]|nr:hypothetical protein ANO11243_068260 [fungal sp. No.11243]
MKRSRNPTVVPGSKRRKVEPVAELTFDPAARQEYLSGFHKRKLQRIKHAQEVAQKREREEKVRDRKELREQRKRDLEQHVAEVNAILKKQIDSSDDENDEEAAEDGGVNEWAGFEDVPAIGGTDEYIDEGKFTTVTIKELDDIRDFESASEDENEATRQDHKPEDAKPAQQEKRKWGRTQSHGDKPKKKKKKFRYESKLERQTSRNKQKLKNAAAAKARRAG